MAEDQTITLSVEALKADANALAAIKKMAGYKSAQPEFELEKLEGAAKTLNYAEAIFAQTEADWQLLRGAHVAAQWAFHHSMLGAKQQVVAQFGDDSDEAQAVGLTKKF